MSTSAVDSNQRTPSPAPTQRPRSQSPLTGDPKDDFPKNRSDVPSRIAANKNQWFNLTSSSSSNASSCSQSVTSTASSQDAILLPAVELIRKTNPFEFDPTIFSSIATPPPPPSSLAAHPRPPPLPMPQLHSPIPRSTGGILPSPHYRTYQHQPVASSTMGDSNGSQSRFPRAAYGSQIQTRSQKALEAPKQENSPWQRLQELSALVKLESELNAAMLSPRSPLANANPNMEESDDDERFGSIAASNQPSLERPRRTPQRKAASKSSLDKSDYMPESDDSDDNKPSASTAVPVPMEPDNALITIPSFPFAEVPGLEEKARRRCRKSDRALELEMADSGKADHPYDDCICCEGIFTEERRLRRREPVISTHGLLTITLSPAYHQVKDFNLLPALKVKVSRDKGIIVENGSTEDFKTDDHLIIRLVCDAKMPRKRRCPIFLSAVPVLYGLDDSGENLLTNLKVTQSMLPGRTKGFKFYILVTLMHDDKPVDFVLSHPFLLWSNVNQESFPRQQRTAFLRRRIDTNRKRRTRNDSDGEEQEEEDRPPKPVTRLAAKKTTARAAKAAANASVGRKKHTKSDSGFDTDEEEDQQVDRPAPAPAPPPPAILRRRTRTDLDDDLQAEDSDYATASPSKKQKML